MMTSGSFDEIGPETPFDGVTRRTLDTAKATVTEYVFAPGATFPLHEHPQEQITLILEGSVHMTAGEQSETLTAGGWSVVTGGVVHGITAGADGARFLATLVPRRAATDAYTIIDQAGTTETTP